MSDPDEAEKNKECAYCGECSEKDFCNNACKKAYLNDMNDES